MRTLRILHVISSLASASGGPTQVLKDLVIAQANLGHHITIITTNRSNPVEEKLPSEYFEKFSPPNIIIKTFAVLCETLLFSPSMLIWFHYHLKSFDIIHIHGLYRFPPTCAAWMARRQSIPYVIIPHGALDPYLYKRSTSGNLKLKRLYERWFDLPNLNSAGAIHYTAEEERQRTSFLGLNAPSFIVPNGVDWSRYDKLPQRGRLRSHWGLGDDPVILFLGRLHFKKGLDLLIHAFAKLRSNISNVQLVIAGPDNDDYGKIVREWVGEYRLDTSVHFVGPLQGGDVVQAYMDADVFVLPSYTENFGMTVAEAMACHLPVVISDQVNIHAEVAAAGAGLVTRCNADEVTAAMEVLLRDPGLRQSMGEAGRKLVREQYTWPSIVQALTKEYEAVIERHRGGIRKPARYSTTVGTR